jgi:hypothetical protein
MVMCGVPFEVRTEILNIMWKSLGFKGLIECTSEGCAAHVKIAGKLK